MNILRPLRKSKKDNNADMDANQSHTSSTERRGAWKARAKERAQQKKTEKRKALDKSLSQLNQRLGITSSQHTHRTAASLHVDATDQLARSIFYSSDLDGYAEPGEVVWVTVPTSPPQERSMLVIGRNLHNVLGLLISSHRGQTNESHWIEIGNGEWDTSADQCWLRLDKTIVVPETQVSRRGILFPRPRFEVVANRLRNSFSWA